MLARQLLRIVSNQSHDGRLFSAILPLARAFHSSETASNLVTNVSSPENVVPSSNVATSTTIGGADVESLAGLIYARTELLEAYLSRPEAEHAKMLQDLIARLDPQRKATLMQKLSAVSGDRAAPAVLAWVAATLKQELASAVAASSQDAALLHESLLQLVKLLPSHDAHAGAIQTEKQLVGWLVAPDSPGIKWQHLLSTPSFELLMEAACKQNERLHLACDIVGVKSSAFPPEDKEQLISLALFTASSKGLLAKALGSTESASIPTDLVQQAMTKAAAGQPAPELLQGALGLSLAQFVGVMLGLYLNPHVQLVTRLLGQQPHSHSQAEAGSSSSDAQEPAPAQGRKEAAGGRTEAAGCSAPSAHAAVTVQLLDSVVKQLLEQQQQRATLDAAKLLAQAGPQHQQGSWSHELAAALLQAAGPLGSSSSSSSSSSSPAAQLVSTLFGRRKAAMLAGVPHVMASATSAELSALNDGEVRRLQELTQQLEAVGRVLQAALLPEGASASAVDLDKVQSLSASDRDALAWRLRTPAAAAAASQQLLAAFYRRSLQRHSQRQVESSGYGALVASFQLERDVAELDLVHERHLAPATTSMDPSTLPAVAPSQEELASVRLGLSESEQQLFDLLLEGETASEAQVLAAFEALLEGVGREEDSPAGPMQIPDSLSEWMTGARKEVMRLSPPMLRLMRRFLALKIRASHGDVLEAQQRVRLMLQLVQEELVRADRTASAPSSSSGKPASARTGPSGGVSPFVADLDWSSSKQKQRGTQQASQLVGQMALDSAAGLGVLDPAIAAALMGQSLYHQFGSWLKVVAIQLGGPALTQPHELLAQQHLQMDVARYLQMRHDPGLHLNFESAPQPWRGVPQQSEEQFLDSMRAGLNSYLASQDIAGVSDVEWQAYKAHALAEFSVQREAAEGALREAGGSAFFNARAEEAYLRSLLAAGMSPGSPLFEQANRYLDVLDANTSWSFAAKKRAVQRLVQLSKHFSKQKTTSERGSPFAPLFAAGGAEVVPKLPKLEQEQGAQPDLLPTGY